MSSAKMTKSTEKKVRKTSMMSLQGAMVTSRPKRAKMRKMAKKKAKMNNKTRWISQEKRRSMRLRNQLMRMF